MPGRTVTTFSPHPFLQISYSPMQIVLPWNIVYSRYRKIYFSIPHTLNNASCFVWNMNSIYSMNPLSAQHNRYYRQTPVQTLHTDDVSYLKPHPDNHTGQTYHFIHQNTVHYFTPGYGLFRSRSAHFCIWRYRLRCNSRTPWYLMTVDISSYMMESFFCLWEIPFSCYNIHLFHNAGFLCNMTYSADHCMQCIPCNL